MAAVFTIETGIAMPGRARDGLVATLRQLEVGQSVLVTDTPSRRVSSYTRAARLGTEKFFECRTMTTGVRVWRVE